MQYLNASLRHWLKLQCQSLDNVKAALLVKLDQPRPEILAKWPDASAKNQALLSALKPLREKQRLHLETSEAGGLIIAQPLVLDGNFWGGLIIELGSSDKKKVPEVLKSLQSGQVWLQLLLHQQGLSEAKTPSEPVSGEASNKSEAVNKTANENKEFSGFLSAGITDALLALNIQLLRENSWQEMAISLVNRLATELKAARVSLALQYKNELVLEAVSFSASFDRRTESMRAVVEAMQEAIEQGSSIIYPSGADVPYTPSTAITQAHQQLLHRQQARELQTCLLRKGSQILGAVTLEFNEPRPATTTIEQQQFLTQAIFLASSLLALRMEAEAGVRTTLARGVGRAYGRWFGDSIWKSKIVFGLAVIFFVALWVPADYSISGDANLQSLEKHLVVSPQDAYLGAIHARPGDQVTRGQLLAQLKDDDLRLERRKLISQVQQYRQSYDAALANANRAEAGIANAQAEQANAQLGLIEQQLERTRLSAPVDGMVVSDDIAQRLGAPIKQGETLFEIAAASGFIVQLSIDERDIGWVTSGQEGHIKLASLPGDVFTFRVKSVTPLSEVREGRNYFRVEAELVGDSAALRPGMSGTGKISAGQQALGWIWFHDLWHWLRLSFW